MARDLSIISEFIPKLLTFTRVIKLFGRQHIPGNVVVVIV